MIKKLIITFLVLVLLATSIPLTASAEDNYEQIQAEKEAIIRSEKNRITPRYGSYSLNGYEEDLHNNQTMYVEFSADLNDNFFGSEMDGESYAAWLGATPYNADEIELTTNSKLTGIALSVSAGNSGFEVSAGLTSTELSMTDALSDTWRISQDYTGLTFDGIDLFYRHSAVASFQFGYENYYITATDSVWP